MSVWNNKFMDGFIQRTVKESGVSAFAQVRPLLAFIAGKDKAAMSKLGDPSCGVFFGMNNLPTATRKEMAGAFEFEITYLTSQPAETSKPEARGNTPTSATYQEDLWDTAGLRWTNFMTPGKCGRDEVKRAKGPNALASVFERGTKVMVQDHLDSIYTSIIDGTRTSAQQGVKTWQDMLGIDHTVSDGTTAGETDFTHYGRKDRTASGNDHLQATVLAASDLVTLGYLSDLKPNMSIIRKLEVVYSVGQRRGNGPRLVVTAPALWERLAEEVDGKSSILRSPDNPPAMAVDGFKQNVIEYGNTYVVADPSFMTDTMVGMYLDSWGFQIDSAANFKVSPWRDKAYTEEGGAKHYWSLMETDARIVCDEPHLQWKITGLSYSGS